MNQPQQHGGEIEVLERGTERRRPRFNVAQRGEINQQIATPEAIPSVDQEFVREATEMVSMSRSIAAECMYSPARPRRGLESYRKAVGANGRIVASLGNCRAGARIISEDDRFVTGRKEVLHRPPTKRRDYLRGSPTITTDSKGRKYSDIMVSHRERRLFDRAPATPF